MAKMKEAGAVRLRPFLRWAGGKQMLTTKLLEFLPKGVGSNGCTYFEPFLGAGSLFLAVCPKRAVLSDLNEHLVECFRSVRDNPSEVSRLCKLHAARTSESYYYSIRQRFNANIGAPGTAQTARFIYLNRTCFNGVFRVNREGHFNVPYARTKKLVLLSLDDFKRMSDELEGIELLNCSYERVLDLAKSGDFVYLDPPYPPLNGTSYFTHYTKERFGESDQREVAIVANKLNKRGCRVMITNADLPLVREIYDGWHLRSVQVRRYITCKANRYEIAELVITNYKPGLKL